MPRPEGWITKLREEAREQSAARDAAHSRGAEARWHEQQLAEAAAAPPPSPRPTPEEIAEAERKRQEETRRRQYRHFDHDGRTPNLREAMQEQDARWAAFCAARCDPDRTERLKQESLTQAINDSERHQAQAQAQAQASERQKWARRRYRGGQKP